MKVVRLKGATTLREISLLAVSVTLLMMIFFFVQQYGYLKSRTAFENVTLTTTVNEQRRSLDIYTTFDRNLVCGAKSFEFQLTNIETGEIVVLMPADLVDAPPKNVTPGANQEARYAYALPDYDVSGTWATELVSVFECANGMFTDIKFQTIESNRITIQ